MSGVSCCAAGLSAPRRERQQIVNLSSPLVVRRRRRVRLQGSRSWDTAHFLTLWAETKSRVCLAAICLAGNQQVSVSGRTLLKFLLVLFIVTQWKALHFIFKHANQSGKNTKCKKEQKKNKKRSDHSQITIIHVSTRVAFPSLLELHKTKISQ